MPSVLDEVEAQLQALETEYGVRNADALHDLLRRLGDLSPAEIAQRTEEVDAAAILIAQLERERRIVRATVAGEKRYIAVEDAARYRDALGVPLPPGLPEIWLNKTEDPSAFLAAPLCADAWTIHHRASRSALRRGEHESVEQALTSLNAQGKLLEGEFHPQGSSREWCDPEVLRIIRRKTLARLRKEVEPVDEPVYARLIARWQGVATPRRGMDALLDAVELLQGVALPASVLEREILPARVKEYQRGDLDALIAAGEVLWVGVERLGRRDGRIALYTAQNFARLLPPAELRPPVELSELAQKLLEFLANPGRIVLPCSATSGRRRFFWRDARRALGTGVGRTRHQRHAATAARVGELAAATASDRRKNARLDAPKRCCARATASARPLGKGAGRWWKRDASQLHRAPRSGVPRPRSNC